MEFHQLAMLTRPVHALLQKVAAPTMEITSIYPERLTYTYAVSPEREAKFVELVKRLLVLESTFPDESPLVVAVSRLAQLAEDDRLDFSEWQVQFQVNSFDRPASDVEPMVRAQVEGIILEFETYLHCP